jgi:hypothetical protein
VNACSQHRHNWLFLGYYQFIYCRWFPHVVRNSRVIHRSSDRRICVAICSSIVGSSTGVSYFPRRDRGLCSDQAASEIGCSSSCLRRTRRRGSVDGSAGVTSHITHCLLGHLKPLWCLKTRGTGGEENHCGTWNCWDGMDDPITSYRLFQTRLGYRLSGHIRHEMDSIQRHCTVFSIRLGF